MPVEKVIKWSAIMLVLLTAPLFFYKGFVKQQDEAVLAIPDLQALAGAVEYQKAGCSGCHTRFLRPHVWEVFRFMPGYSRCSRPYSQPSRDLWDIFSMPVYRRVGPDLRGYQKALEYPTLVRAYLENPQKYNPRSTKRSFAYLFQEVMNDSEIVNLKKFWQKKDIYVYNAIEGAVKGKSKGDLILHYLHYSLLQQCGR